MYQFRGTQGIEGKYLYCFNVMKIKRRYKSTGGVGTIKEYVGYSEDHHWYMVTMIPHNKGNARRVQERSISRCFSGYSSFDDVLNADERRKRRRLEERSRVKHLNVEKKALRLHRFPSTKWVILRC